MQPSTTTAIAVTLATITFLIGASSLRLRASRDRAISRSEQLSDSLAKAAREGRPVGDEEVQSSATGFVEAAKIDPLSYVLVGTSWLVAALAIWVIGSDIGWSEWRATAAPDRWSDDFRVEILVDAILLLLLTIGTIDAIMITKELKRRMATTLMATVKLALDARAKDEFQEAIKHATELLKRAPSWPWPLAFRSYCLLMQEKSSEALADIERAQQLDERNPAWAILHGRILLEEDAPADALEQFNKSLQLLPNDYAALQLRGSTNAYLGNVDDALRDFNDAVAINAKSSEARIARGEFILSERQEYSKEPTALLSEIILEDNQKLSVKILTRSGYAHLSKAELDLALSDFEMVLGQDPDNSRALAYRGLCLVRLNRISEGMESFGRAIRVSPRSSEIFRIQSRAYRAMARYQDALDAITTALELDPRPVWFFQRGLIHDENLGNREAAIEDYEQALTKLDDDGHIWSHYGAVLLETGQREAADRAFAKAEELAPDDSHAEFLRARSLLALQQLADAELAASRAVDRDPSDVGSLFLRASIRADRVKYHDALDDIQSAEQLEPKNSRVFLERARILRALRDSSGALDQLNRALELAEPVDTRLRWAILSNRAAVHDKLRNFQQSLDDFNRAAEISEPGPTILVHRGCLLSRMGQFNLGIIDYEKALEIDSTHVGAHLHRARALMKSSGAAAAMDDVDFLAQTDDLGSDDIGWLANIYGRVGRWDDAEQILLRGIEKYPNDEGLLWSYGAGLNNEGRFEPSRLIFSRLIAQNRENWAARIAFAITLSQMGQREAAVSAFAELGEEYPGDPSELFTSYTKPDRLEKYDQVLADWQRAMPDA